MQSSSQLSLMVVVGREQFFFKKKWEIYDAFVCKGNWNFQVSEHLFEVPKWPTERWCFGNLTENTSNNLS